MNSPNITPLAPFRASRGALMYAMAFLVLASSAAAFDAEARTRTRRVAQADTARAVFDPEVWITLASSDLRTLEGALGGARVADLLTPFESYAGVSVALIRESRLGELAAALHEHFGRCGGFIAHPSREEALNALYVPAQPMYPDVAYTIDNGPTVQAVLAQIAEPTTRSIIAQLSNYQNRYYTSSSGVQAAQWLKSRWDTYAQGRSDVRVSYFTHPTWSQPSVIAAVQGTDFPKEVVVIGGHLDSTAAGMPTGLAPGADDDASGIASLSETFRAAMAANYRPARTVMFMGYAAEEVGLKGSAAIATAFQAPTAKYQVIGVLQLDMTNYKGSSVDMGILTDNTHAAQTQFVRDLIGAYLPGVTYANTACGYGCSDHASWHNRGFPASMVFEALFGQHNQQLHKTTDTLDYMGGTANHAVKFSKLAAAYMAELAKGTIVTPLDGHAEGDGGAK